MRERVWHPENNINSLLGRVRLFLRALSGSLDNFLHDRVEFILRFKAYTWNAGQANASILDGDTVGESTEWLEHVGIGFVATEAKPCGNMERHLVSAVRDAGSWRPAMILQHFQDAEIFDKPIAQSRVKLQNIAVLTHTAVSNQISSVLQGK